MATIGRPLMLNALTNSKTLALLLFVIASAYSIPPDSVPIAEYCVSYEKKGSYYNACDYYANEDCEDEYGDCELKSRECDSYSYPVSAYLYLEKILQKQPRIITCERYLSSSFNTDEKNFFWLNKFLIHDDLKSERDRENSYYYVGWSGGVLGSSNCYIKKKYSYSTGISWHFAYEIPVYAKNGTIVDFGKYYKKGKIVSVEWELKTKCGSLYNAVYSGKYHIRITGECPK